MGWILVGDERVASARMQGFVIHRTLRSRGVCSDILNEPEGFDRRLRWRPVRRWSQAILRRRDVLVFQKVDSSRAVKLAHLARRMGTRVVFAQSDPHDSPMYRHVDGIVASSTELGRWLETRVAPPVTVIDDPLDLPRDFQTHPSNRREGLRLLWIGHRSNFASLASVRAILERSDLRDMTLVSVSDHPEADYAWSPELVLRELSLADVAVITFDESGFAAMKSANRAALFMGAGLPVIATPVPSYREFVEHGQNGFLAGAPEAWMECLRLVRDPAVRTALGAAARRTAWTRFDPEKIADRWMAFLKRLLAKRGPARRSPPIDIPEGPQLAD